MMEKQEMIDKHSRANSIVQELFLGIGKNLVEYKCPEIEFYSYKNRLEEIDYYKIAANSLPKRLQWMIRDGVVISEEEFNERASKQIKYTYRRSHGDFLLEGEKHYKGDIYVKVVGSKYVSPKSALGFHGKFFVFCDFDCPKNSKIVKKNTLQNYARTMLTSGRLINIEKIKNFCTIDQFQTYLIMKEILTSDEDRYLLERSVFYKVDAGDSRK